MTSRWLTLAIASAVLAAGVVSAQTLRDDIALVMPATATGSLADVPGAIDATAARAAIEKNNSDWLSAFRAGDTTALGRMYSPDANLFPPSNVSLEGVENIVDYFDHQRRTGMDEPSLKTLDVVCVGDVAYEVGTYGFRFTSGDGVIGGDSGRYFAIWKVQPDGSWRYQVGIWSSNRDTRTASAD